MGSSSLPPSTITLDHHHYSSNLNNYNDTDLEQTTPLLSKIKALGTLRDKSYLKLGTTTIDEEKALLECKIKRYDARIDTLKDQEERCSKYYAMFRDDIHQINSLLNAKMTRFAVLQGLLFVAATPITVSITRTDAVNLLRLYLMILAFLGMVVSALTLVKIVGAHETLDQLTQDWERHEATVGSSELTTVGWRSLNRVEPVIPIVFFAAWLLVFITAITMG
jgi:hypothetical protein